VGVGVTRLSQTVLPGILAYTNAVQAPVKEMAMPGGAHVNNEAYVM